MSHPPKKNTEPPRRGTPVNPLSRAEVDLLRDQIIDLVGKKTEKAAIILTTWVNQADRRHSSKGKKAA